MTHHYGNGLPRYLAAQRLCARSGEAFEVSKPRPSFLNLVVQLAGVGAFLYVAGIFL